MGNGTTTEGTPTPIAPGSPQTLVLGSPLYLVVTVRDLAGTPLPGARVVARVDGADGASGDTDDTGLVALRVTPRASLQARASLPDFVGDLSPNVTTTVDGEAFVTLRLRKSYSPTYLFAWQNPILLERIYRKHPDDPGQDPGAPVGAGGDVDLRSRQQRLLDFIDLIGSEVGAGAAPGPVGTTPALTEMLAVDARLATMEANAGTSAGLSDEEEAQLATDRDGIRDRAGLTGHAARTWDARTRTLTAARAARSADEVAAVAEARRSLGALITAERRALIPHDSIVEYIVTRVLPAAPADALPDWLRYMVLHYSGLRYVNSKYSYMPPQWILARLRGREIANEIPASGERLRRYLGEARSLADGLPRSFFNGIPSSSRHRASSLTGLLDFAAANPTDTSEVLQAFHAALADHWTEALSPNDATALVALRRPAGTMPDTYKLTAEEWKGARYLTLLRADLDEAWDPPLWHPSTPLPLVADPDHPRARPRPMRRPARPSLFVGDFMSSWSSFHEGTLALTAFGAECNQIAELAAHARGFEITSGIARGASQTHFAARAAAEEADSAATEAAADGTGGEAAADAPPASPPRLGSWSVRAAAPRASDDGHRIWRARFLDELQQGDVFFLMKWMKMTDERCRGSNWVYTDTPMEWLLGNALAGADDAEHALDSDPAQGSGAAERSRSAAQIDAFPLVDRSRIYTADTVTPLEGLQPGDSTDLYGRVVGTDDSGHTLGHYVVRRHPSHRVFTQFLGWYHEGTIVGTKPGFILTLETNAPTGVRRRPASNFLPTAPRDGSAPAPLWNVAFGRPPARDSMPDCSYFLDRNNLLRRTGR